MFRPQRAAVPIQKWGGLASFVLAVAFIASSLLYFTGNLRDALGPLAYSLADLLAGPVWAASLVTVVVALREHDGHSAPRRMDLALIVSVAAACLFLAVACIRSANRHYHLVHPELGLESDRTVLIVWATLVAGMLGTAWHALGWVLLLIGSAGWTSARLPRPLSALYMLAGAVSLFVYVLPDMEMSALLLVVVVTASQGMLLLKASSKDEGEEPAVR